MWFDDLIRALDDLALQQVMREIDLFEDAGIAFNGVENETIEKVSRNLSSRAKTRFEETLLNSITYYNGTGDLVMKEQLKIGKIIQNLADIGGIVLPYNALEGYQTIKKLSLPSSLIEEKKNKSEEVIGRIEAAVKSSKSLDLRGFLGFKLQDVQTGFAAFQNRKEELCRIRHLRIDLKIIEGAIPLFELGLLESLEIRSDSDKTSSVFPESIGKCKNLKKLLFTDIKELPAWIQNFSLLSSLHFCAKNITSLPEWLWELQGITDLTMTYLSTLPAGVGKLRALKTLNLNNGTFSSLPESMAKLSMLTSLDLSHTKIKDLPENIGAMPCLKELRLTGNSIEKFPDSVISNEYLYVHYNDLVPAKGSLSYDDFITLCYNILTKVIAFSKKGRMEGLLALEEEIDDIEDEFFKAGLRLVVDGTDAEIIRSILTNYIKQEHNHYRKILRRLEMEGILSIQAGDIPGKIFVTLDSMVQLSGHEYKDIFNKYLDGEDIFTDFSLPIPKRPAPQNREEVQFILHAIEYSEKTWRKGLLIMEKLLDREMIAARDIFEYGMIFVIDGENASFIDKILTNLIERETDPVKRNLCQAKKEAVLSIHAGDSPRILAMKLLSFFEDDIAHIVEKEYLH
ncbi:hypothetical protein FACS189447_06450 [Spirochaetia bacterium]|nr:hypothetical protein FACS189447_06450 [Spirochaetia bacterium]